jgi:hypothetical protein
LLWRALKEICDFFPLDGGLAPFVELAEHPMVGGLNFWIFLSEFPMKMLTGYENQTGDARVFGQGDFQGATYQFRYVERRIHGPELVQPIGMNSSPSPMSVAAIKRVFVGYRLAHLSVKFPELIEDREIRLVVGVVPHPDKV